MLFSLDVGRCLVRQWNGKHNIGQKYAQGHIRVDISSTRDTNGDLDVPESDKLYRHYAFQVIENKLLILYKIKCVSDVLRDNTDF